MFKKLKKSFIYEEIINQIKKSIMDGELKPGDRLPSERTMTEMFGISRMSLREALKSLSVIGMIEAHPGEGYYISQDYDRGLSSLNLMSFYFEDVRFSVLETRMIIEPEAVQLAVDRITDKQLQELDDCVEEMFQCLEGPNRSYLIPDKRFHQIIFEATHNVVLINMLKTLGEIIVEIPEGKEQSALEHREILEAIKIGDKNEAKKLMVKHLMTTRRNVLSQLQDKVISEKIAFEA